MRNALPEQLEVTMLAKMNMICWKGEKFWVGKFLEYPEIMTQGETIEELEDNMRDAWVLMTEDELIRPAQSVIL